MTRTVHQNRSGKASSFRSVHSILIFLIIVNIYILLSGKGKAPRFRGALCFLQYALILPLGSGGASRRPGGGENRALFSVHPVLVH